MKRNLRLLWTIVSGGALLFGIAFLANAQPDGSRVGGKVAYKWLAAGKHVYIVNQPTLSIASEGHTDSRVLIEILEGEREKRLLTPHPEHGISSAVYLITEVGDDYIVLKPMSAVIAVGTRGKVAGLRETVLPLASIAEVQLRDESAKDRE